MTAGRAQGANTNDTKMIKATLRKSTIGALPQIKATVVSLGFRRMKHKRGN